ncbi:MAG: helix-turn-helix domain-containing protein [Caldilineaceae bacterium]|nr:helix-turn-helix domain-containing protein [Caldilineaceae bacterium]
MHDSSHAVTSFGHWVKARRKILRFTQAQLADLAHCSKETIRKIESDARRPSEELAATLARALALPKERRALFIDAARGRRRVALLPGPDELPGDSVTGAAPKLTLPDHNLPRQLTPFIGRDNDLAALEEHLLRPECALLTLLGQGGIGKTRLALAVAQRLLPAFRDGVRFVDLAVINAPDVIHAGRSQTGDRPSATVATTTTADAIATAIAQTLPLSFTPGAPIADQVVDYLAEQDMLMILDNYEHLLPRLELIHALLHKAHNVTLLVTSRVRLRHVGEWVYDLAGLALPSADGNGRKNGNGEQANPLAYDGPRLFLAGSRRINAQVMHDPETTAAIVDICRAVDGLPLGIELASAWTRRRSCREIAATLADTLTDTGPLPAPQLHGLPQRQSNLHAVVQYSWELLTPGLQTLLARLVVFQDPFDLPAAARVAGATGAQLAALRDSSLLNSDGAFFFFHAVIRHFVTQQPTAQAQEPGLRRLHADYFMQWVEEQQAGLTGPEPEPTLAGFDRRVEDIRAAWRYAASNRVAEFLIMGAPVLNMYYNYRTLLQEGKENFHFAVRCLDEGPSGAKIEEAQAYCRIRYGMYAFRNEEFVTAETALRAGVALAQRHGLTNEIIYGTYLLGYLGLNHLPCEEGIAYAEEALAMARAHSNRRMESMLLGVLGELYSKHGRLDKAKDALLAGIALAEANEDQLNIATFSENLAGVYYELEEIPQAITLYEKCMILFEVLQVAWGQAFVFYGLTRCYLKADDWDKARYYYALLEPLRTHVKAHEELFESLDGEMDAFLRRRRDA